MVEDEYEEQIKHEDLLTLRCPILVYLVLVLLVYVLDITKISRTTTSRSTVLHGALISTIVALVLGGSGMWLLLSLCNKHHPLVTTTVAFMLPFIFFFVLTLVSSASLGTNYTLFN